MTGTGRRALLGAGLATAWIGRAAAQAARTMRIVVPYTPGGGADLLARALAAHVGAKAGRTVVVENRPGATGTIGAASVARSAPDGDTLLQADAAPVSIQPLANRLPYGPDDFVAVARLVTSPVLIAVKADSPIRTLADVVARARAEPGGVTYATNGILGHFHLAMERFAQIAGIELTHVPFQGTAPGITAALAGQVVIVVAPPASLQDQPGLRAVASMTEAPITEIPGIPTFRAGGVDMVFDGWRGLFAPRGTPPDRVAALETLVTDAFADPGFVAQVRRIGETPAVLGAEAFRRFWDADRAVIAELLARVPRN